MLSTLHGTFTYAMTVITSSAINIESIHKAFH